MKIHFSLWCASKNVEQSIGMFMRLLPEANPEGFPLVLSRISTTMCYTDLLAEKCQTTTDGKFLTCSIRIHGVNTTDTINADMFTFESWLPH